MVIAKKFKKYFEEILGEGIFFLSTQMEGASIYDGITMYFLQEWNFKNFP